MAQVADSVLKSYFEAGDQPTQGNFSDLIDSKLNVADAVFSTFGINVTGPGYGAVGDGIADDFPAWSQANEDLHAAGGGTIYAPVGTYRLADDLDFYDDVHVRIEVGADIAPAVGVTVSNLMLANQPTHQIFSGSGTVVPSQNMLLVLPQWWGAGSGIADNAPAFQKMFDSISDGMRILLVGSSAPYIFDAKVTITSKQRLEIEGIGMPQAKLSTSTNWGTTNYKYMWNFLDCTRISIKGIHFHGNGAVLESMITGWHVLVCAQSTFDTYADNTIKSFEFTVENCKFTNGCSRWLAVRLHRGFYCRNNYFYQGHHVGQESNDGLCMTRSHDCWVMDNEFDGGSNSSTSTGFRNSLVCASPGHAGTPPRNDIFTQAYNHAKEIGYLNPAKHFTVPASTDATTDYTLDYSGFTVTGATGEASSSNEFWFLCYDIGSGASGGYVPGDHIKVVSHDPVAKTVVLRRMDGGDAASSVATNWGGQSFYWSSADLSVFLTNIHIQNNKFKNCGGGGVFILACRQWSISGNKAMGNIGDISLDAEFCIDGGFYDNVVYNPINTGIAMLFLARNVVISGNSIYPSAGVGGILLYSGTCINNNLVIANNVTHPGISLQPQGGTPWNNIMEAVVVTGNIIHGAPNRTVGGIGGGTLGGGGLGIGTQTNSDLGGLVRTCLVQGNIFHSASQRAILYNMCEGLTIIDNMFNDQGYDAIFDVNSAHRQSGRVYIDRNILNNVAYRLGGSGALWKSNVGIALNDNPRFGPNNVWRNTDPSKDGTQTYASELGSSVLALAPVGARVTWDPDSMNTMTGTSTTVTVTGARVGEFAHASFSVAIPAGVFMMASVTSNDTVTVSLFNSTGGTVSLGSGTLRVKTTRA